MLPEPDPAIERARTASSDDLKGLVQASDNDILLALLENPNFAESHVALLLERLDLPADVLGAVAAQSKWMSSEAVRLRLASHPRTPKRVALAAARQLYLFDLVRLSVLTSAPADIKRVAEEILIARVPHLPIGQKLTLARRGPARVAGAILAEGHAQAVKLTLNNASLTESQVLKVLAQPRAAERVVAAIAQHPKWSHQYNVRLSLIRNPHTPVPCVLAFLPHLNLGDLRQIAETQTLAVHLRRYIEQELARRRQNQEGAAG